MRVLILLYNYGKNHVKYLKQKFNYIVRSHHIVERWILIKIKKETTRRMFDKKI